MKLSVRADELAALLDRVPAGVRWLSLDCFDTLVWRNVHAPVDVFTDLGVPGGAIEPRRRAEGAARRETRFADGRSEVAIEAIHHKLRPGADADAVAASVAAELEAEARHCFGFAPVIALVDAAKARGLGVMIVSDTYLNERQLRALIGAAAGEPVAAMIDRVFCSSEHGVSKGDGLFRIVLDQLGAKPGEIFHVGDNRIADQIAPAALGISSAHFRQFDEVAAQRLRLEAVAASMIDGRVRDDRPALQPHRPLISLRSEKDPAHALGHDVLGPVLTGFAEWVRAEADALEAQSGKPVHLLFLLRDGHLPHRIYRSLFDDPRAKTVEISRLTAARASFVDEAAIHAHLANEASRSSCEVIARQLLFDRDEIARLAAKSGKAPDAAFLSQITRPSTLTQIVTRSSRFAERLLAHLRQAGVRDGDAVMFVDLGYNGSVQNLAAPMLRQRMGLEVAGRYLLLREDVPSGLAKRGYLDTRHHDFRTLDALCDPIAVVEQLCTIGQGSVIDYKADGTPVRAAAGVKGAQSATRDQVQQGCVAFAEAVRSWCGPRASSDDPEARRMAAAAALARLLFLPVAAEIELLQAFDHDVNLGTKDNVKLIDPALSADGLRRQGMFYLNQAARMYLPGEIRGTGLPHTLSLLAARRFGLELTRADFNGDPIKLPVLLADERGQAALQIDAWPTHDGYYAAAIPAGAARYTVAVQWGQVCDWVQIQEAAFHRVEGFGQPGAKQQEPVAAVQIHDAMDDAGGGLFRCTTEAAFTLAPPPSGIKGEAMLLHVIFRPVVRRGDALTARKAA